VVIQSEIVLKARSRGFHLITDEILTQLDLSMHRQGILNIFIKHTSAGLTINENCDPDVRIDFDSVFNRLIPENLSFLKHTLEGPDDMPAHIKASLVGFSVSIPITDGVLNLGTWQGIYLCEFRNHGGARKIVCIIQA